MNDLKKINKILRDHEKRIRILEDREVRNPFKKPFANTRKMRQKSKSKSENLFPLIQKLFDSEFFREWKTDLDVCEVLKVRLLTKKKPLRASIVNVLRVMVKKGLLVRDKIRKDKRKVFAYKQS